MTRRPAGPGFVDVLRLPVFARLFAAESQSIVGDQLARVALAVLVFDATDSALATASVYALTFLPAVLSGVLAGGLADRWSKRRVMIACDLLRAALYLLMAVPGIPLPAVCVALVLSVFMGPVFTAAEVSYLAAALPPEEFRVATGIRMMTGQLAQVGGFAVGGIVVAVLEPQGALALNAATFVGSALLISTLRRMPSVPAETADVPPAGSAPDVELGTGSAVRNAFTVAGIARLLRVPGLPRLLALSSLAGLYVVPEGLAVPFGRDLSASTVQIGVLLASIPLGATLGIVFLVRVVGEAHRERTFRLMAAGCGVPLVIGAFLPGWHLPATCWFVSGFMSAYQVDALSAMMRTTPAALQARLVGVGTAVLIGAQGLGLLVFGGLASTWSAGAAIGAAGGAGVLLALGLTVSPTGRRLLPA